MYRNVKFILAYFALFLVLIVFLSFSCTVRKPTAAKVIKIGINLDLTGATAAKSSGLLLQAAQDYVRYINEVQGGIKGAKLELMWADSGYSIPRLLSNYTRFKEAGAVTILVQASQEGFTVKPLAEKDKIPVFSHAVDANVFWPPGWVYTSGGGSTPEFFAVFLKWLKENWKETRPPRVAIIGWDNTLGRAPQSVKKYIEETKVEIVAEEYLPVITMDFSSYLLRIQKASPDYIFAGMAAGGMGPFLRDTERLGIRGKIPIIGNGVVPMYSFIGSAGEYLEGMMSFDSRSSSSESVAGIQNMKDIYQKLQGKPFYDDEESANGYLWGWIEIIVSTEIIRQTIEATSLERLSSETMKATLDKGAKIDTGGLTRPLTYGAEKRRGNDYAKMMQWKRGTAVPVSNWIEIPVVKP